jgi:hypothetical protein
VSPPCFLISLLDFTISPLDFPSKIFLYLYESSCIFHQYPCISVSDLLYLPQISLDLPSHISMCLRGSHCISSRGLPDLFQIFSYRVPISQDFLQIFSGSPCVPSMPPCIFPGLHHISTEFPIVALPVSLRISLYIPSISLHLLRSSRQGSPSATSI